MEELGARIIRLPGDERGFVDLDSLLSTLPALGINSLMVEGGARVITSFLSQKFADWVVITIAPIFLGGLHAIENPLVPSMRYDAVSGSLPQLNNCKYEQVGKDIIFWSAVSWDPPPG